MVEDLIVESLLVRDLVVKGVLWPRRDDWPLVDVAAARPDPLRDDGAAFGGRRQSRHRAAQSRNGDVVSPAPLGEDVLPATAWRVATRAARSCSPGVDDGNLALALRVRYTKWQLAYQVAYHLAAHRESPVGAAFALSLDAQVSTCNTFSASTTSW